jgi:D-alanyl-D-alanine carboxypeptidase
MAKPRSTATAAASTPAPASDSVLTPLLPQIEQQIEQHVSRTGTPGLAFGIVRGGALVWSRGFGFADIAANRAPDADTLFRVGSITKTFTATALVQLRDAGKLSLDDPLVKHIPEFSTAQSRFGPIEQVTLRRLASHHAGIVGEPPFDHWQTLDFPSMTAIIGGLAGVSVGIPPDSAFKYSNLAFALLGEVVARVTGQPYEKHVTSAILKPLGMTSSVFSLTAALRPRMAVGYEGHPYDDVPLPSAHPLLAGESAAGQLYSSVNDLAKWITLQLTAEPRGLVANDAPESPVLSRASLFEMQQPLYLEPNWSAGYGVSWLSARKGDNVFVGHSGGVHGFLTRILFNLPQQSGVIALTNGQVAADQLALDVLDTIVSASAAQSAAPRPQPTPDAWRELLGLYVSTTLGASVLLEYRNGVLQLRIPTPPGVPAPPTSPLIPTGDSNAFLVNGGRYSGELLVFERTAEGAIRGFTVSGFALRKLSQN